MEVIALWADTPASFVEVPEVGILWSHEEVQAAKEKEGNPPRRKEQRQNSRGAKGKPPFTIFPRFKSHH